MTTRLWSINTPYLRYNLTALTDTGSNHSYISLDQAAFLEGKVQRRESLPAGRIRLNSERRNSIAAKIATDQAERAAHRAAQDTKDKEFAEFLRNLEIDSAHDVHSVETTKMTIKEVTTMIQQFWCF